MVPGVDVFICCPPNTGVSNIPDTQRAPTGKEGRLSFQMLHDCKELAANFAWLFSGGKQRADSSVLRLHGGRSLDSQEVVVLNWNSQDWANSIKRDEEAGVLLWWTSVCEQRQTAATAVRYNVKFQ